MSGSSTHTGKPSSPYYVAIYKGHSVAIRRDADYEATIKLVQNAIPKLRTVDPHDVFISTILPDYGDLSVQISKDIWSDVVEHIKNADIKLSEDLSFDAVTSVTPNEETIATASQTNSPQAHQASPESLDPISITIYTAALKVLKFDDISPSITIEELKERIETTYKVPFALQDLILRGTRLKDHKTLAQCSVITTTSLALIVRWRKPMIYLSAPHKIIKKKINIQIALNRAWESAALGVSFEKPPTEYSQSVSWDINVLNDGAITQHNSLPSLKVKGTCLLWDGIRSNLSSTLVSPLTSLTPSRDRLESLTSLNHKNSVAMPSYRVESYITSVFEMAGFRHKVDLDRIPISRTNLRLSNGYIALRFLPQVEYETIAPLSVSPDPDRVVRLVLLFKTLSIESFQAWDLYRPSYCQGAGIWKDIIGWEETNAKSSFEVFEVTCTEVY